QWNRRMRRGGHDALDACGGPAVKDGGIFQCGDGSGSAVEVIEVDAAVAPSGTVELTSREGEWRAQLGQGLDDARSRLDSACSIFGMRAGFRQLSYGLDATDVRCGMLPTVWAHEVDELTALQIGGQPGFGVAVNLVPSFV